MTEHRSNEHQARDLTIRDWDMRHKFIVVFTDQLIIEVQPSPPAPGGGKPQNLLIWGLLVPFSVALGARVGGEIIVRLLL